MFFFRTTNLKFRIALAIIPLIPIIVILAAVMTGEIWDWSIHRCENKDPNCYRSPFDRFTLEGVNFVSK